ncbi:hypothetical protein HJA77_10840 [Rhizobium bangladeshense]|nr:hypothetical protein [Rhizobium bangladeshense]MBX4898780.1 hypothetical protein [Rhizobium bangladeshense]MBX4920714.1 hypothetical protein [Rhizobium bangladeshense]MBY3581656.1 hypothetical protein [Rhizobium bangladeshense]MBY3616923.1 hypothetical protein [Rhizobium bangladeshense]
MKRQLAQLSSIHLYGSRAWKAKAELVREFRTVFDEHEIFFSNTLSQQGFCKHAGSRTQLNDWARLR